MEKKLIENYAKLIVRKGINVQKGQDVIITANTDQESFVTLLMEECYKRGAKKITVKWVSDKTSFIKYTYEDEETLSTLPDWKFEEQKEINKKLPATIYIESSDPEALKGLDLNKFSNAQKKIRAAIKPFRDKRENKYQWVIAGAPSKEWAAKIFPEDTAEDAYEKLWKAILQTSRALEGNPEENWEKHNAFLKKHYDYLNSLNLVSLHYSSSNGTDFTVGLNKNIDWLGGGEINHINNTFYNPNIPSEEIFTSPLKGQAEGIVYSSKPLSFQGQVIENFSVRFEKGRAVEVHAEKNEDFLKQVIETDEGASYLGEVALVPFESPVNQTGILFLSTLYDENAACHLAFGLGFTSLIRGYEKMSKEEIESFGINDSALHLDFMIGTEDLSITGKTDDGKSVEIFKNGTWAF